MSPVEFSITPSIENRRTRWLRILSMSWPLIVANSFWNLQLTIDRIFLGSYSTEALAAAVAVMGVFWTPMALLQQTASYVMTFVAQYFGAKEQERIGPAVWQALHLSIIGGLAFLLFIPLSSPLFNAMGHAKNVAQLETEYFAALCYSAMPTAIVAAISGFFTGLGRTKAVIGINLVGLLGNALFDYLLIFGNLGFPALGVAGAGYATAIGTWLSAFYGFYLMFGKQNESLYKFKSGWRLDWNLQKRFLKYGLPSGLQWALEGLAFTVFLIIVGRMQNGAASLAASGIVVTIMMLSVMPAMGVAQAVSVLVGQHLGEKKPDLAVRDTWAGFQVSAMYIATMGLSFIVFPGFYLGWFHNPADPVLWSEVSKIATVLLCFVAVFTCFDAANFVFSFALKGAGDTKFVSIVALLLPWPIFVLPTWLFSDWTGSIYWAWGAASIYSIILATIFWRRFEGGRWKSMTVIHG